MTTSDSASQVKDVTAEHAQQAAYGMQARDVASTAADQVQAVTSETVRQARNLLSEAKDQASSQAANQTQRAATSLRSLSDELRQMAWSGSGGPATELVHQAADRLEHGAGYLENRQPADLLEELRSYARRRPGAFLAGAAVLGLVAGRLTRGVKDATTDSRGSERPTGSITLPETSYPSAYRPASFQTDDASMGVRR